jgi:hypothetical protein
MTSLKYLPIIALLAACTPQSAQQASIIPEAKDGWREYPLAAGVVKMQPAKFKSETIDIPVPQASELEYKLAMKKGDTIVYSISYGGLTQPADMLVEFHGHTEQVDGVGDLMYYSKTEGVTEHGAFTAPWDGIHGWYLKNNGANDLTAKLEVAGYYEKTQ